MRYTKTLTYAEAFLIMQTHKAKIVAWPCRQGDTHFVLLVQDDNPEPEQMIEVMSPLLAAVTYPAPRFKDYSGAVWR